MTVTCSMSLTQLEHQNAEVKTAIKDRDVEDRDVACKVYSCSMVPICKISSNDERIEPLK